MLSPDRYRLRILAVSASLSVPVILVPLRSAAPDEALGFDAFARADAVRAVPGEALLVDLLVAMAQPLPLRGTAPALDSVC